MYCRIQRDTQKFINKLAQQKHLPGSPGSQISQAPTVPPPSFIPQQAAATPFAVDPGAIRLCLFRNTFIWLSHGEAFWFYPIFIGPGFVAGFGWNGRFWTIHLRVF